MSILLILLLLVSIIATTTLILRSAKKFKLSDEQLKRIKEREAAQRKKDDELDE